MDGKLELASNSFMTEIPVIKKLVEANQWSGFYMIGKSVMKDLSLYSAAPSKVMRHQGSGVIPDRVFLGFPSNRVIFRSPSVLRLFLMSSVIRYSLVYSLIGSSLSFSLIGSSDSLQDAESSFLQHVLILGEFI